MNRWTTISIAWASLLLAAPAFGQTVLTVAAFHTEPGYTPDGLAVGDVHPNAGDEIVVVLEGSNWYANDVVPGTGRALVLDADLNVLTVFDPPADRELMGLPLIEQLDTGNLEYLVGEFRSAVLGGSVYALRGTDTSSATAPWIHTDRAWAGLYNQGPSSGNLLAAGGDELVIPSWDGLVQILRRSDGQPLATHALAEHLYGHAAIADVDGIAGREIVVVGHDTGAVYALSPDGAGGFTVAYQSVGQVSSAFGSGPAIADLDGDGSPEIIVTLTDPPAIRAFDAASGLLDCEFYWTPPAGADYAWTSPVVGDVDNDGVIEIVVESTDSQVSILSTQGLPANPGACTAGVHEVVSHTVGAGGPAWFTPALADVTGDGAPDIIVASYTDLEVLDVAAGGVVTVAYAATQPGANFYPSASIIGGVGGARASIYVSGWVDGTLYRYDITGGGTTDQNWPGTMGNNARTGFCCADDDCSTCAGGSCSEPCAGTCTCDDPSCDCTLDCTGANCDPVCEGGSTCSIVCDDSNNCEPACRDASVCDIGCNGTNNCKVVECSGGSTCSVVCDGGNNCEIACDASTCVMECSDVNNCKDFTCERISTCSTSCTDVNNCEMDCLSGSECVLECGTGVGSCKFNECHSNDEMTCPSGHVVCNRDCTGLSSTSDIRHPTLDA